LDDDVVLVDLRTSRIYSLNHTAARAWELLSTGAERTEVERSLLEEFDVDPSELSASLDDLLERLGAENLVSPR
jgi:hypothetical protein